MGRKKNTISAVNPGYFLVDHEDGAATAGEHTLGAVGAACKVNVRRFIDVNLHQGMRFAHTLCQAGCAGLANLPIDLRVKHLPGSPHPGGDSLNKAAPGAAQPVQLLHRRGNSYN